MGQVDVGDERAFGVDGADDVRGRSDTRQDGNRQRSRACIEQGHDWIARHSDGLEDDVYVAESGIRSGRRNLQIVVVPCRRDGCRTEASRGGYGSWLVQQPGSIVCRIDGRCQRRSEYVLRILQVDRVYHGFGSRSLRIKSDGQQLGYIVVRHDHRLAGGQRLEDHGYSHRRCKQAGRDDDVVVRSGANDRRLSRRRGGSHNAQAKVRSTAVVVRFQNRVQQCGEVPLVINRVDHILGRADPRIDEDRQRTGGKVQNDAKRISRRASWHEDDIDAGQIRGGRRIEDHQIIVVAG